MPDAPFLTGSFGEESATLSYQQAHLEIQWRAALLAHWGMKRGERVGIIGRNSIDLVLAVLATLEATGVGVLLDHNDPPARVAARAEFTNARFVLHDAVSTSLAEACGSAERLCTFDQFAQLSASRQDTVVNEPPKPTDGALIFFTSGTTGMPKAVVQSHYSVAQNAYSLARHHGIAAGVRLMCVLPLHHVNGLEFTVFSAMSGGGHTFIQRGFDGLNFWKQADEAGVHIVSLVPNLLRLLAERPQLRGGRAPQLRYAVSAAAPLSTTVARSVWESLGLRIVQGYGLSEVTNFSCVMPPNSTEQEYDRWMLQGPRTSVGPALPGQEVRIRCGDEPAQLGTEGEVLIRGHCVMNGYLHNEAATEAAFAGGWFHTGDVGYYLEDDDQHSFIHLSGRSREIAKRSGALVNLLELDEVLASIPGVAEAASASFSNTWVDEEIGAAVVRSPGTALTQDGIVEHCRRVLPFAAVPKAILFVEEIPRTVTGKIRRGEIAQRFSEFRETLFREPPAQRNSVSSQGENP
jgi:long-chain acyl-CoA synthetase